MHINNLLPYDNYRLESDLSKDQLLNLLGENFDKNKKSPLRRSYTFNLDNKRWITKTMFTRVNGMLINRKEGVVVEISITLKPIFSFFAYLFLGVAGIILLLFIPLYFWIGTTTALIMLCTLGFPLFYYLPLLIITRVECSSMLSDLKQKFKIQSVKRYAPKIAIINPKKRI